MAENKFIVGYSGLSRVVDLPARDLMLMVADGRIPLTVYRISGDVGFDPDEVAKWLGNGCPGVEWKGESLSFQCADIVIALEDIFAKLFHTVHVQRAHCRILYDTHPANVRYTNRLLNQSLQLISLLYVSSMVGDDLTPGEHVQVLKALRDADYTKLTDLIGGHWISAIRLTKTTAGHADIWDPTIGWSLAAEIERRTEGAHAGV